MKAFGSLAISALLQLVAFGNVEGRLGDDHIIAKQRKAQLDVAHTQHREDHSRDDYYEESYVFVSSRYYAGGDFHSYGYDDRNDSEDRKRDRKSDHKKNKKDLLEWADEECSDMADAAGLPGHYHAWLSDDRESPATRFVMTDDKKNGDRRKFVMTDRDRSVVATGWDMLTSGQLSNPLIYDEDGYRVDFGYVWTGTSLDGKHSGSSCDGWASGDSDQYGTVGEIGMMFNGDWTDYGLARCDGTMFHIYCFEDGYNDH